MRSAVIGAFVTSLTLLLLPGINFSLGLAILSFFVGGFLGYVYEELIY